MAEPVASSVVSLLAEKFKDVIFSEINLLSGVQGKIENLEKHLSSMHDFLEKDKDPANNRTATIQDIANRAEDLIESYLTKQRLARRTTGFYRRSITWMGQRSVSKQLDALIVELETVRGQKYYAPLQVQKEGISLLPPVVAEGIRWVTAELGPLDDFLKDIDGVQVTGKRQKIWIQELRDVFGIINFPDFKNEEATAQFWISSNSDGFNYGLFPEIQYKIIQLYRRYYAYGFGQILVANGSIFPKIWMSNPIPYESILLFREAYSSMEMLRVDLKLMKGLLEDAISMGDLDERVKVWLGHIQEISLDLEAVLQSEVEHSNNFSKIRPKLKQIGCEIHDVSARKMTYGINTAMGEAGFINFNFCEDRLHELYMSVNHPVHKKICAILEDKSISETDLTRLIQSVTRELELMRALFEDANRMEKLDARLKFWLEEMLGLAREANAAVVEVDLKSSHERIEAANRIKKVYNHIHIMSMWKHTYDIGDVKSSGTVIFNHYLKEAGPYPSEPVEKELELLRREIKLKQALYCDVNKIVELNVAAGASMERDKFGQLSEIKMAYGIEPRKRFSPLIVREIKGKLLKDDENSNIIPIIGMRHTDKVALQELIDNDRAIRNHFDSCTWVEVPVVLSATSILEYMARQIMEQQKSTILEVESKSEAELMGMLQEVLMSRENLIVLDEIHTIEGWQFLERAFQKISTRSRIILITNGYIGSTFESKPTAIVKLRELRPKFVHLMHSYLRRCAFYFLLFPANLEVPTRRLIVLWVAEGLVRAKGGESPEDAADRYLTELIDEEIVCVTQRKLNGKVKACKLSEGKRDALMKAAQQSGFFRNAYDKITHLVDHHGTSDSCFIEINQNPNSSSTSVLDYKKVRSFLSFNTQEGSKPGENIGNFLHKCISAGCFRELNVVDFEKVFRPKLPMSFSKLILLKYLGLRWTYLEILPEYIKELLNLQVLDVKHTYISILPKAIWEMEYLRHLYLSETYRTRFPARPSSSASLEYLQTLWGAFIDEDTMVEGGLDSILHIRKLGLSCQSRSSRDMRKQLQAVGNWISKLKFLDNLRLKSRDGDGKASELYLRPLYSYRTLSTVYLLGKLQQDIVPSFPETLIEITLSGSELPDDPMEYLEKLPNLLILRLLARSVMCLTMHCSKERFRKLKVLKIWKLENLMNWEVDKKAMPALEDLEIRACNNLKMLPNELQHVTTLRKFTLTSMPETFIKETRDRQSELWAKIVPQVE